MNLYLFKFIRPSGLYISLSLFIARRAETEVVQKKTKREQLKIAAWINARWSLLVNTFLLLLFCMIQWQSNRATNKSDFWNANTSLASYYFDFVSSFHFSVRMEVIFLTTTRYMPKLKFAIESRHWTGSSKITTFGFIQDKTFSM